MSRALKQNDVLELSKLYEAEFNQPDLHDRVLVFDVVASWPHRVSIPNVEENERNDNEASDQTEDGSEGEKAEIEKEGMSMNTDDENGTESPDCEITSKYVNGNQQIENKESNQSKDDDSRTKTNENETAPTENEASNEIQENKIEDATVTDKNETTLNENIDICQNTSNEIDTRSQDESKLTEDDNYASCSLKSEKQNENSSEPSSSENYEASHLHESEKPTLNDKDQSGNSSEGDEASYPTSNKFIRQHKFYIHSSWLAVQSPYFRSLFFCGMKESNAKEVHVHISASEEQAHLMLLEAMYKIDILDNASVDELLEVLILAHKYDVKFVFKKCKYCLQAAVISLEICEKIMRFIKVDKNITDVEDLINTLQSFLAKEFSPLDKTWQTTSFKELCEPSLKYLLSSDELIIASENTIFHALVYWIEHRGIDSFSKSQELPSLLSVVRFEFMPIDYLYNHVQHNSVVKKLADFNDHYLRGISYHALSNEIKESLPNQPVKRKASTVIPYTWVIPTNKWDRLVGTDQELKSDEFYFGGYRMVLTINHVVMDKKTSSDFSATLSLAVMNLTQHSIVEILWHPASQSFLSYGYSDKRYKFKNNAHVSSFAIRYTTKVPTEFTLDSEPFLNQEISTRPCLSIDVKMKLV